MTDEKNKPRLDEQTFAKLLEAAYVLQEHNRKMRRVEESLELHSEQLRQQEVETQAALQTSTHLPEENSPPNSDYALILAEIVEAQHQIQRGNLESDEAMAMVAGKIARITNASGAAIGILEGQTIRYRAGAGAPALPLGSEVPLETAICAISVSTGQVLRTPDINMELLFDPDLCRKRQILSLVAVPIYHDGNIVGALELYFDRLQGFAEQDIQTCQLMAGLVSEAIGQGTESALKKSMAAERSAMLTAIEKLRPNLSVLAEDQTPDIADKDHAWEADVAKSSVCWKCGDVLVEQEQFCGKCGASRAGEGDQSSIQSKLASAMRMQSSVREAFSPNGSELPRNTAAAYAAEDQDHLAQLLALSELQENTPLLEQSTGAGADEGAIRLLSSIAPQRGDNDLQASPVAPIESKQQDVTWRSAAKARDFLEALAETRSPGALGRLWRARRGDFYLVVAVILMFFVIRWGMLSGNSVGATGHGTAISGTVNRRRPPTPDADLSLFDKLMISLGLAEAPEVPQYKGNPNTQVWIDPHTALYYCPDSDLYGKTSKGRFASQRDAQLDQFESASRKACD
ncbi:MAG: GAF domain-containing protein [Candidatus Sulfotelmatobacter sp.]